MPNEISFEEFAGIAQPTKPAKPLVMSAAEFTGQEGLQAADVEPSPLKQFMGSAAAVLDFPLSLPGFLMGVGTTVGATAAGVAAKPLSGETWKEVYAEGRRIGGNVAEKFTNPLQKALAFWGVEKEYQDAPVTQALEFVAKKIEEAGALTELTTKGGIPQEAVQSMADVMMIAGIPGLSRLGRAVKEKVTTPDMKARDAAAQKRLEYGYGEGLTEDLLGSLKAERAAKQAQPIAPMPKPELEPLEFKPEELPLYRGEEGKVTGVEPQLEPRITGPRPEDILSRLDEMKADRLAVESGQMPLEWAQQRHDLRTLRNARNELPAGLDYSGFEAELRSRGLVERMELADQASRESAWGRYQQSELSRKSAEIEEAYRQRAEQRGEAPAPSWYGQGGTGKARRLAGPGAREGGAVDLSVFEDAARVAYKAGQDLRAKAAEVLDKYGEDAARVFINTYQREELRARALPDGAIAKVLKRAGESETVKSLDWTLGATSTQIKNISEPVWHRMVEFERRVLGETHKALERTDPFFVELNKLKGEQAAEIERAILTNDQARVEQLLARTQNAKLISGWKEVRRVIEEMGDKAEAYGIIKKRLPEYFPRVVTDKAGLFEVLNAQARSRLERAIADAQKRMLQKADRELTPIEESALINNYLKGYTPQHFKPGFAKDRSISEITEQLQPFYATPTETFHTYVRNMTAEVEKAKLFGKDLKRIEAEGYNAFDIDESIGGLVRRELEGGRISQDQVDRLTELLKARFGAGERGSHWFIQDVKNLGNAGLLGNPVSAVTQFGDLASVVFTQGLKPTVSAVVKQLTGKAPVKARDWGLVDHISEEFVSTRATAKMVNTTFKLGLFSGVDLFGKSVALNAALNKFQSLAKSQKGIDQIARKYGGAYGEELPQLVADLKARRRTDLVDSLLFHELSGIQPISKLEMPPAYLNNPNGRVLYWLKTFTLKQLDLVRNTAYADIKAGRTAQGMEKLVRYGTLMGIAGATTDMVKDWMLGRKVDFEARDIPLNMMKTFGWSEYALSKVAEGKPLEATAGIVAPPYKMFDKIISADPQAVQYMPVVGKVFESHFLGGAERADKAATKRKRQRQTEGMSPAQKELYRSMRP